MLLLRQFYLYGSINVSFVKTEKKIVLTLYNNSKIKERSGIDDFFVNGKPRYLKMTTNQNKKNVRS